MKLMKPRNPAHEAQEWAYDFHSKVLRDLPPQIRNNIDWDMVAEDLRAESPSEVPPTVTDAIRRIVDYLYEEEAADYQTMERHLQREHIFESVLMVEGWLEQS